MMFWALGTHLGRGVSQSALGDLLGLVRDETPPGQPESARGYLSRRELSLHVDLAQIVGLMCVRPLPRRAREMATEIKGRGQPTRSSGGRSSG